MTHIYVRYTKQLLLFSSLILFGISVSGCSSNTTENHTLTIIGTADIQGNMEAFEESYDINGTEEKSLIGGIDRIATVLKEAKAKNPAGTFILSSGDDLMGRYFHTFEGKAIYDLMSQSGYMLYAPGNHEFDKGTEIFANALDDTSFKTLCSDLITEGTALEGKCLPYTIKESNGVTIGFFSLMTESFPLITSPGKVKLLADNITSATKMVKLLQDRRCDIIVAITHIGLEQDKLLASKVKGIDVIFGGHSHLPTKTLVKVDNTLIVNAGEEGTDVVSLSLPIDTQNHILTESVNYALIPITGTISSDTQVAETLKTYQAQLPPSVVLGTTTVAWDLTTDTLRRGESNVADMINDLLKNDFNVDIVMNNAGAFRGKMVYPPGDITDTRLHEIDEFSNNAYILDIEGKYIRQILEHSAALYGEGGLMQVAGLHYTFDLTKRAQVIEQNSDGSWQIVTEGERVTQISIVKPDGTLTPLDETKTYHLLSNAYLVTHAGDGYFWFAAYGTKPLNTYTTFYSVMARYLETHKIMDPKPVDGRLQVIP